MITLGIDLSSQKKNTSACLIDWNEEYSVCSEPSTSCSDDDLDRLISEADVIGVDAPFGWPLAFANAVTEWSYSHWNDQLRDEMRFRETDREIRTRTGKVPLSVSTNLIALPAMRAMALLNRHGVIDKSGGDKGFYEVYPGASLAIWNLHKAGYKKKENVDIRKRMLNEIRKKFPNLEIPDTYTKTDDNLDALVASITVKDAAKGKTRSPTVAQLPLARQEGWIHAPY